MLDKDNAHLLGDSCCFNYIPLLEFLLTPGPYLLACQLR